jgi:hypothetical protein
MRSIRVVASALRQSDQQGLALLIGEGLELLTKPGAEAVEEVEVGTGRFTFTHVAVAAVLEEKTAPEFKRCA